MDRDAAILEVDKLLEKAYEASKSKVMQEENWKCKYENLLVQFREYRQATTDERTRLRETIAENYTEIERQKRSFLKQIAGKTAHKEQLDELKAKLEARDKSLATVCLRRNKLIRRCLQLGRCLKERKLHNPHKRRLRPPGWQELE